jgi:hypothetical protein
VCAASRISKGTGESPIAAIAAICRLVSVRPLLTRCAFRPSETVSASQGSEGLPSGGRNAALDKLGAAARETPSRCAKKVLPLSAQPRITIPEETWGHLN